ncbi:RNAse P Rpr2/Rpp21/SNM1 subunit domain [Geosmithia morbida]|uniref:RNAse P Rpr2/Rpp21/SNM1 subunit domain n=1 Tax=Geosmithia morbida TaxID=1094350 RepID=A0A9P4YXM5_9HYPO|nr:RNAse P Rpr2/Rpp21/SNM1 subunit domain [Geosmithia morbida]KAF4123669.1 RNAse P Rpr2/Rpp21/SNM1 subunit domain [Geosmithia morbida]
MSNDDSLMPTLQYLTDAAYLTMTRSPTVSARLMRQRSNLLFQNDLSPSPVQRQLSCGACGTILIPGMGSTTVKLEPRRTHARRTHARRTHARRIQSGSSSSSSSSSGGDAKNSDSNTKTNSKPSSSSTRSCGVAATKRGTDKAIRCSRCRKTTRIDLGAPPPASRPKKTKVGGGKPAAAAAAAKGTASASPLPENKSANASSKKRAKNRRAGLQALLAGHQQQKNSSPLSLGSFLKR